MTREAVLRGVVCCVAYFLTAVTLRYTLHPPTFTYPILVGVFVVASMTLFQNHDARAA